MPERGYQLALIPAVPVPRRPSAALLSLPGRLRAAVARPRSRSWWTPGPTWSSASAATSRCRPTSPPGAGKVPFVVHEANARPGLANRLGARFTPYVAVAAAGTPLPRARLRRHAAAPGDRPRSTGPRSGRRRARPSASTPTGRPCWSSAARRARVGSTTRSSGRRGALAAAGVQVLHAVGPRNEVQVPRAAGRAALRRRPVPRPDGPRVRRGRPRAVPGRDDDLRRAGRRGPAGALRPAAASATASSGSTRSPWSTPAAGCSSTTPSCTPEWVRGHAGAAAARHRPAGRDGARPPRASGAATRTSGWPTSSSRPPGSRPMTGADQLPARGPLGRVHFVGIGGAGMSGIARIMLARGVPVSGSDAKDSRELAALRALGAPPCIVGHDAEQLGRGRHRGGLHRDPGRQPRAGRGAACAGCGCCTAPQALAAVMAGRRVVAVAGTHGKTTTTSMLTVALQHCGVDPSFAIGGELNESGANAHDGSGELFVAEADESDGSFLLPVAVRRRRHQRRGRPPRPLRHRRGLRRGVHPVRRPAGPGRVPRHLRRRPRRASAGRAGPGRRPSGGHLRRGCRRATAGRAGRPRPDRVPLRAVRRRPPRWAPSSCGCPASTTCSTPPRRSRPACGWASRSPGWPQGLAQFAGTRRRLEVKGERRGRPGLRQLRPPPDRDRGRPAGRPRDRGGGAARGGLPAAPVQPDPHLRRAARRRPWAWPTTSSSWTSTRLGRTRSPG